VGRFARLCAAANGSATNSAVAAVDEEKCIFLKDRRKVYVTTDCILQLNSTGKDSRGDVWGPVWESNSRHELWRRKGVFSWSRDAEYLRGLVAHSWTKGLGMNACSKQRLILDDAYRAETLYGDGWEDGVLYGQRLFASFLGERGHDRGDLVAD